jgi:hypothetical protein
MEYFQTKNPNLGKFWRVLEWDKLVYSIAIRNILRPLGVHLWAFGNLVAIWHIFSRFGILCRERSGNPGWQTVDANAMHDDTLRQKLVSSISGHANTHKAGSSSKIRRWINTRLI